MKFPWRETCLFGCAAMRRCLLTIIPAALLILAPACPAYFEMTTTAGYEYFYPCSSGVIDCSSFAPHEYGDYGLTNDIPAPIVARYPNETASEWFGVAASNDLGEAVGSVGGGDLAAEFIPAEGANGVVICVGYSYGGCEDSQTDFTDINNNGSIAGINWADGPVIATFGQSAYDLFQPNNGQWATLLNANIALVNDQNMILTDAYPVNPDGTVYPYGPGVEGVWTVAPVPEPTSLILLAAAAGLLVYRGRTRKTQGIERPPVQAPWMQRCRNKVSESVCN